MWAKNELKNCSFDSVFLLPLRDDRVSSTENISDLVCLFHSCEEICKTIIKKIKKGNGKDMLLIFHGWDEFKARDQNRSFILDIVQRKVLQSCNIMITSRTYATASLPRITNIRHIEVLGFQKQDIFSFVRKNLAHDKAKQLIKELIVRDDVLTLCYIPFVCSMLLTVYCQCDYILPNTLTESFKQFVLHYVKRSMEKKGLDPEMIESFSNLTKPKHDIQRKAFDELCFCAYSNLKTQSSTFTRDEIEELTYSSVFKHFELMQFYKIAGIITYQFSHLTIQEFLSAWWISQQDDQEKLFQEHFGDVHFRMTLRLVAGLTELKDDSYQEYFNKEVDLQCVRRPLSGFEFHQYSVFHQNPQMICDDILYDEYPLYESYYDTDTIHLLHLIYESQNKTLCQIFVSSIKNSSVCVDRVKSSQFDLLCLSFLLKQSNITWNYLHYEYVHDKQKHSDEDSNMTNCIVMKARYDDITSVIKIHRSSLCQYLQESYIDVFYMSDTIHHNSIVIMFTQLFKLPHLSILHVHINSILSHQSEEHIENELLLEMAKVLSTNLTIKDFLIKLSDMELNTLISSLLTGVERNYTIQFFSLSSDSTHTQSLQIEELLKNNQTLQAVKLNIPIEGLLKSPCIVNKSLTALNISNETAHDIMIAYSVKKINNLSSGLDNVRRHFAKMKSLSLYKPLIPLIIHMDSNPFLHHLDIVLQKEDILEELFNILSSNTTIIALRIECEYYFFFHNEVEKSLQFMLSSNKSLQCLDIKSRASNCTLLIQYLTTSLRGNNTLQELNVDIKVSKNSKFKELFEATDNLKSLTIIFYTGVISKQVWTSLYYKEIIPHVTNMLRRNEYMKFLKVTFWRSSLS